MIQTAVPLTEGRRAFTVALALMLAITAARLVVLFATPVELYPDEAQYWVWSRDLAWGYVSKPPMVAWLIAGATAVGGASEPWVRIASVLLHGAAPLFLFDVARRLYGPREALLTVALYSLMPGVQLSAGIASTDAPLLFCLAGALWAYVRLLEAPVRGRRAAAWGAGVGLFLGLAFLSKYAAAYALVGLIAHALACEDARRAWRPRAIAAAGLALAALAAPNLGWNAQHQFATFAHTARNADWSGTSVFHPGEVIGFLASQIGVFGPVPFVAVALGAAMAVRRRGAPAADILLLCLAAPPILAVTIQALLSRANANWAFTTYVPASVLAAGLLVRWGARRWAVVGLTLQGVLAALFLACVLQPAVADALGLANSLKRARGWRETAEAVLDRAAADPALTAVAVDNRFLYNELRYYGRDRLERPGAPPLRMWVREARPLNQAELAAPLTAPAGGRVLAIGRTPEFQPEFMADFTQVQAQPPIRVRLDARRTRDLAVFVGVGLRRLPRDPITGLPPQPGGRP